MQHIKMTHYLFEPGDCIFVKGYGLLSFAKNMGKNISKSGSKSLHSKYSQNLFDHAKESATDSFKTVLKRVNQKTEEAAGDLIC